MIRLRGSRRRALVLGLFATLLSLAHCHRPMDKIDSLHDAWLNSDREAASRVLDVVQCPSPPATVSMTACLDAAARAFGSTGFSEQHPDQASAAAVAFVVARGKAGDGLPAPDTWIAAVAGAPGVGADALRLAVATGMAEAAPRVGKHVEEEVDARAMMAAVAASVPGACDTYGALGRGDPLTSFSPAASPDHSPCVQHDLQRKDGPGPAYGDGVWRAAAGAAALWREEVRALEASVAVNDGAVKRALEKKLEVIEAATKELQVHVVTTTQQGQYKATDAHRADGVPLGADAGNKPSSP
jgi:hypothetical protein